MYVRLIFFAVVVGAFSTSLNAQELKPADLVDNVKVRSAVTRNLNASEAAELKSFVSAGTKASAERRYGPAIKAWATAAIIQPNSANLTMVAESILLELGLASGKNQSDTKHATVLPIALQYYEAALASEDIKPTLGAARSIVQAQSSCLKRYINEKIFDTNCGPLVWSQAKKAN